MKMIIGVGEYSTEIASRLHDAGIEDIMLSANRFWRPNANKFSNFEGWTHDINFNIWLDSGGFVAARKYGKWRYKIDDYVRFATEEAFAQHYFAQDFCCEPEIAQDHAEVRLRIQKTVVSLRETHNWIREYDAEYLKNRETQLTRKPSYFQLPPADPTPLPVPCVQGWHPDDYEYCCELMDREIFQFEGGWPDLIGVGSVCRRDLHGEYGGLLKVVGRLDQILPSHVKLHLFGVKAAGAEALKEHPRCFSCDSQAHFMGARFEANRLKIKRTQAFRGDFAVNWYRKQESRLLTNQQLLSF